MAHTIGLSELKPFIARTKPLIGDLYRDYHGAGNGETGHVDDVHAQEHVAEEIREDNDEGGGQVGNRYCSPHRCCLCCRKMACIQHR
jgi:hypothetical protein